MAETLAVLGLRRAPVESDGFCLANALLEVARDLFAAHGVTSGPELYGFVASYLEKLPDWGELEYAARDVWAGEQPGSYGHYFALAGTPAGQQQMHQDVVRQLRLAAEQDAGTDFSGWVGAAFDLALAAAARRLDLHVTIVYDDGRQHVLTPDGHVRVTLVRPSANHWEAAVPAGGLAGAAVPAAGVPGGRASGRAGLEEAPGGMLTWNGLELSAGDRWLRYGDKRSRLTAAVAAVLRELIRADGTVLTVADLKARTGQTARVSTIITSST